MIMVLCTQCLNSATAPVKDPFHRGRMEVMAQLYDATVIHSIVTSDCPGMSLKEQC